MNQLKFLINVISIKLTLIENIFKVLYMVKMYYDIKDNIFIVLDTNYEDI